ncbi:hypothetical protein TNCV_771031 [Trichonephila clavipes]|nr:hypothetical protein TNCV_771031 [Trichonephila clavipes]
MMKTTPELTPPSPNFQTTPTGGYLILDIINAHWFQRHKAQIYDSVRYLDHKCLASRTGIHPITELHSKNLDFHPVFNTKLQKSKRRSWSPALVPAPGSCAPHDEPGYIIQHPRRVSAEGVARDKGIRL